MDKRVALFVCIMAIMFVLPMALFIWIIWPELLSFGPGKVTEVIEWLMMAVSYIPIFLAQSALAGCLVYIFFRKKNRPALFGVACSVIALVLVLLILYFMILHAFWRNDGWLFDINILRLFHRSNFTQRQ